MAGSNLNEKLLLALQENDIASARAAARQMSIGEIASILETDIAPSFPETCDQFVEAWLEDLSPSERFAAASRTSSIYLLELFWLPQAADKMTKRLLESAALTINGIQDVLSDLALTADIPEVSFGKSFVDRFQAIRDSPAQELAQELARGSQEIVIHD